MNPRLRFSDFPMTNVPELPKPQVKALWNCENSGVVEYFNDVYCKLTRGKLLKLDNWGDSKSWQQSKWDQLDQYNQQGMFGTPIPAYSDMAIFQLV